MQFQKGNKFWQARSKHGRDKIFSDPEVLWEACCEYFDWVEDNPLISAKPFSYEGESWNHDVPLMRAMTIMGLCNFLGIVEKTWANYRSDPEFLQVITRAEQIIKTQKFEGASAGLLNPTIIARDLGLRDKDQSDTLDHYTQLLKHALQPIPEAARDDKQGERED